MHQINSKHEYYNECDELCFLSKNLYNAANFVVRQEFFKSNTYLTASEIQKLFQGVSVDYLALPAKVSQQTLRVLDSNWKSYFKSIKDWSKNKAKYLGKPKLPKYLVSAEFLFLPIFKAFKWPFAPVIFIFFMAKLQFQVTSNALINL